MSPLGIARLGSLIESLPDLPDLPIPGGFEDGLPPGPRGLDNLGFILRTTEDFMKPLCQMSLDYGPIAATNSRGRTIVAVSDHEMARQVLVTNQDNYTKGLEYEILRIVLGNGLLTSEGETWRRNRRLAQPMFAKRHLGEFTGYMVAAANDSLSHGPLAGLSEGQEIDINRAMMELTLDVVGRALFGADLSGETARRVGPAMNDVLTLGTMMVRRLPTFILASLPGMDLRRAISVYPESRRFAASLGDLRSVISELIDSRQAAGDPGDDLIGLMIQARDPETGEGMDRREIADELMTFMLAGHETTSNALSWTFRWLSLNPEVRDAMLEEVDSVVGEGTPDMEDVDRMPWTRAVIEESMRLTPPVWMIGRRAIDEDRLGGYRIPAGGSVMILIRMIHRDPNVWDNPEGFDPRRFLPGRKERIPRQAYMPFGAGRRICIGSTFAMIEAVLLLAMVSRRFVFDLPTGLVVEEDASITLRPRNGLPMIARPRQPASPGTA